MRWKSVSLPFSAEYVHIGATHMRFWNVTSRILRGVKSVGGLGESALPAGGVCAGVKKGTFSAGIVLGAIFYEEKKGSNEKRGRRRIPILLSAHEMMVQ